MLHPVLPKQFPCEKLRLVLLVNVAGCKREAGRQAGEVENDDWESRWSGICTICGGGNRAAARWWWWGVGKQLISRGPYTARMLMQKMIFAIASWIFTVRGRRQGIDEERGL